jgi:hypothetical protein
MPYTAYTAPLKENKYVKQWTALKKKETSKKYIFK